MMTIMAFSLHDPKAIAIAFLVIVSLTIVYRASTNPIRSLPGPWHSRFTRIPLKLAIMSGRRAFYVHDLHQTYGGVVRIAPNEVAISDLEGLATIHRIGSGFRKTEWYQEFTADADRHNIFTMTDPKQHAARRRLFARPFSRTFLLQHWQDTVKEITQHAVSRMKETAAGNGGRLDVLQWWTFMTMDVSGRLMFGHDFDNISRGTVSDIMRTITSRISVRGIGVELPVVTAVGKVLKHIPITTIQDFFGPNDVLYEYGRKYLDSIKASETSSNIFSNIAAEGEAGEKLSMDDVHLEASGLIIAGTDTTAVTLTYLVWAVLSQPALQKELEQEVAALSDDFGETDVEKLPLLNAVIEETLRLYGAAPAGLPRSVPPGGVTIDNQVIPAGTTVTTQAYTYHRDPALFPRPLEFLPSRWLNDGISPAAKKAFHPLGAGSRVCLGMHLAYMELRLATAEFFRRCPGAKLAAETTDETMDMENYFLITPRGHKCEIILPGK